jgi:hypothetical protein
MFFTAVTIKNAIVWNVVPCRSCLSRLSVECQFKQDLHGATPQKLAFSKILFTHYFKRKISISP